ncbi:hypothetical protein TWF281_002063 [Arthrobotrys megalospora]
MQDVAAFWLLGFFVVLLIVVQPRSWAILRYLVYLRKRTVRLNGGNDPMLEISQTEANQSQSSPAHLYGFEEEEEEQEEDTGPISSWFGAFALLNALTFTLAGVLLPLWLTTGIETPTVRSRRTPYCDARFAKLFNIARHKENYSTAHAQYERCWNHYHRRMNEDDSSCSNAPKKLSVVLHDKKCPFHPNVCLKDTPTLAIKQLDISFRDLGINSRSNMTMNHMLVCTPLNLEHLITARNKQPILSVRDFFGQQPREWEKDGSWIYLNTFNGPNIHSNKSSGRLITNSSIEGWGRAVSLPIYDGFYNSTAIAPLKYHPYLRLANATVFVVLYIAQLQQSYVSPLDDPVFAAHIKLSEKGGYHPDYEATGIGCFEEFQYCSGTARPDMRQCTRWGVWDQHFKLVERHLRRHGPEEDLWEFLLTSQRMAELLSVYKHTALNTLLTDYLKSSTLRGMATGKRYSTRKTLWADEVLSWYFKSWWYATVKFRNVVTTADAEDYLNGTTTWADGEERFGNLPRKVADKWGWCGRILLEDGDFTNVNFVGFMAAMFGMVVIFLVSYANFWIRFMSGMKLADRILSVPVRLANRWARFRHERSIPKNEGRPYAYEMVVISGTRQAPDAHEAVAEDDLSLPMSEGSRSWFPFELRR